MNVYFKRFILLIATIAVLATTSGCSISEKTCMQNDWQTLGYKHGEDGKSADVLNRFVKDCAEHGVTPDAGAYSVGYGVGIALYCTAENGLKVGRDANNYSGACPAELEKPFLEQYLDGLHLARDELQIEYNWDALELNRLQAVYRVRLPLAGQHYGLPVQYTGLSLSGQYHFHARQYHYIDDGRIGLLLSRLSVNINKRLSINSNIREWSGRT